MFSCSGTAVRPDQTTSEDKRRVYCARSDDDGKTFGPGRRSPTAPGVRLLGMKSFADPAGTVFALYRAAGAGVHRWPPSPFPAITG
jgi:hypothetical protein